MAGGLNRTRARELWERAAALGDTEAMYLLGQLHEAGTNRQAQCQPGSQLAWRFGWRPSSQGAACAENSEGKNGVAVSPAAYKPMGLAQAELLAFPAVHAAGPRSSTGRQ